MTTTSTHPCAACGGRQTFSGVLCGAYLRADDRRVFLVHVVRDGSALCDQVADENLCNDPYSPGAAGPATCKVCLRRACPVCLGAGQFSDQMPARDALADAETLRLQACGLVTWKRSEQELAASEAWHNGEGAVYSMQYHGRADVSVPAHASEMAYRAARAAFRACPGLRGEK